MSWLHPMKAAAATCLAEALGITYPQAIGGLVLLEQHAFGRVTKLSPAQLNLILSTAFGLTEPGLPIARDLLEGIGALERHEYGDDEDGWEVVAL
mgnify:CR=1 FL=1